MKRMRKMNKKAMMDDMFDFLFTVFMAVFIFAFVSVYFSSGIQNSKDQTFELVAEFKLIDSSINNLRVGMHKGMELDAEKIGDQIENSKKIDGKTITICGDYTNKVNCIGDPVGVGGGNCRWFTDECLIVKG